MINDANVKIDECEPIVVTLTGMVCLWRALKTGETRAVVVGIFLKKWKEDEKVPAALKDLLVAASEGRATYLR